MADYSLPTSDLNSPFYMRQVERHLNDWGKYPDYFISYLYECVDCGGYFSKVNMERDDTKFYNWPWEKKGKCIYCASEQYFRSLAKTFLRNQINRPTNQLPEWLIELEVIAAKTRFVLSNKKSWCKIKIPQL